MNKVPRLDHAYDGIEEYDNPLPGWWKWLFIATIVLSPPYWFYFHSGVDGRDDAAIYNLALAANTRLQFEEIGNLKPDEATILTYMNKDSWVKVGESVFKSQCISCHGKEGEGQIGPNLTDESFKNIRKVEDIARVINVGANAGAMPAWASRLHPNEVVLVSSYVASLRGKNLKGPRPAEGGEIPPWPAPPPSDETAKAGVSK
jgi:cytochrome c oxidase cbb3-type subunit III